VSNPCTGPFAIEGAEPGDTLVVRLREIVPTRSWAVSANPDDFGLFSYERFEAYQLVSQVGGCRVGNVVDPNYSVVAKFPKQYLPH